MLSLLSQPTYRNLFAAQVVALLGTGLATVALGLLAWEIAGGAAGQVLGTALAIKMVAYVTLAPIAAALAERLPRRAMLIGLDLIRAMVAGVLPFASEAWHIYGLIFLLQAASAGFTPAFQATIPEILPDEADYTRALSLSRLAYDLEALVSPMLAAALLSIVSFPVLFGGTVIGFLGSAALIISTTLPQPDPAPQSGLWHRTTRGLRLYCAAAPLRGVLALCLSVSAVGAIVLVNTVVIVQTSLGLNSAHVALALAAFGGGSMVSALALPGILERRADRTVMLSGAALMVCAGLMAARLSSFPELVVLWALLGFGFGTALTPIGRILRRVATAQDLPALFAAHFSLSHLCWLFCYPMAGWLGAHAGLGTTTFVMSLLGMLSVLLALWIWPRQPEPVPHSHPELPADHPHLQEHGAHPHRHPVVFDALHPHWP